MLTETYRGIKRGAAKWHAPAAALDLARYPFPAKVLRPGESAVATARVEPKGRIPGKRRWYPPWLRFDAATPLCRRTPHPNLRYGLSGGLSVPPVAVSTIGTAITAIAIIGMNQPADNPTPHPGNHDHQLVVVATPGAATVGAVYR